VSSNASRAATLVRALQAGIEGDREVLDELYTDDVRAWTPALSAATRQELLDRLALVDDAFSETELEVAPLDVGGDFACVEWRVTMTHSGTIELADGIKLDATGLRVAVNGVTVAEFRDDQICSLRQYWDEFSVLEQLGVLTERPAQS
jgi:ketosteroid isomerase-like protein